jgi:bacterioferritin-associated ferredoxin
MNHACTARNCDDCSRQYLCRCLKVTEEALSEAIESHNLRTLQEIKQHTGAGDGCMACTKRVLQFLNELNARRFRPLELATAAG